MSDPLITHAASIATAYASNNTISPDELPALIKTIHQTLISLSEGPSSKTASSTPAPPRRLEPAVPIERSVFRDYIICLEDGLKLKMLKRHLNASYGMTPEQYRAKWGLPHSYPMVAPAYAEHRREVAYNIGLGTVATRSNEPPAKAKRGPGRPRRDQS